MNRKQRACIVSGFFLLVLSLLFAPTHPYRSPLVSYRFLFTGQGTIDFARLFVEWLLIAVVTGGLFYLLRGPDSPKPETRPLASERNWRRLFWLSIALSVLVVALGITSYRLFRKVGTLKARIQNLKIIVAELPPPGTPLQTMTVKEVVQAAQSDIQYDYDPDIWAAWVAVKRQDLDTCLGHIRRVREELKPD